MTDHKKGKLIVLPKDPKAAQAALERYYAESLKKGKIAEGVKSDDPLPGEGPDEGIFRGSQSS